MASNSPQDAPNVSDTEISQLERSLRKPRTLFSMFLSGTVTTATFVALVPLFSVIFMLFYRGASHLTFSMFVNLPPTALEKTPGGFGNALVGTLVMVAIAALISVPFGIMAAIFLSESPPGSRVAGTVRFCAKVLSGFPSILAGVFAFGLIVLTMKSFSAYAGGIALSVLMLPIVMLTAEEAIRMVPSKMKEASYGMGATQTQTLWYVTLPTALPGVFTGVILAVARAAGETAPLLFTARWSGEWLINKNGDWELDEATASMAYLIYEFSGRPYENQIALAWSASLVLVLMVLSLNLIGRAISREKHTR